MLMMTIMLLFWYIPLQRVYIHRRLRFQTRTWLILWKMICWMQWNEKMLRYAMNLILDVGRNMKCMMTLNLCLTPLKKTPDINYRYGFLKQPTEKHILSRLTILFISHIMSEIVEKYKRKLTREGTIKVRF